MKLLKQFIFVFLVIFIVLIGLKLRLKDYANVPFPGESLDEYSSSWVGLSLIEFGKPVGTSVLGGYKDPLFRYVNVDRIFSSVASTGPLLIQKPWFDHPPMLGLITGGFAYLKGVRNFEDTVAVIIRKPIVYLSSLTILLLIYFAYLVSGPVIALLSGIIYSTSPLIVISSRMVQAENGYLPFLLLSLICLLLYERKNKEYFIWMAGLFSALCITFKIPGVVASLTGVAILMTQDSKSISHMIKESLFFLSISLLGFVAFIVYGLTIDWSTFATIFFSNTTRYYGIGFNALHDIIIRTKITGGKIMTDGWPLLGWISLSNLFDKKKSVAYRYLLLPILLYLLIYLLVGSSPYGWYRIPFMPFLYISLSIFLYDSFYTINKSIIAAFLLLIPTGINLQKMSDMTDVKTLNLIVSIWKFGILGIVALPLIAIMFNKKNRQLSYYLTFFFKLAFLGFVALSIYTNFSYNNLITVDYWYKSN